jgi:anti-sigma B factor antagonist
VRASVPQQGFSVRVLPEAGPSVRLAAAGELDIATAGILRDALRVQIAAGQDVLLDLGAVNFMDASGIRVILDAIADAKVNGLKLGLVPDLHPHVRKMLELTAILPLLAPDAD